MKIEKERTRTSIRYRVYIDQVTPVGQYPGYIELVYAVAEDRTKVHIRNFPAATPALEDLPALIDALEKVLEVDRKHRSEQAA